MAEAAKPPTASPNGQAALRSGPVAERVVKLRELARERPEEAREQAWEWIQALGRQAASDWSGAREGLQELFACGQPADAVDGQTEGTLVTWTMHPIPDRLIGSITNAWMPWLGKKFFPPEKRGINTLTNSARWPAKILWPFYSTGDASLGREAFDFNTYLEKGKLDPSVAALVIDYESVTKNPRLLIRQIRDELVQVVPGANLGTMLVKPPRGR